MEEVLCRLKGSMDRLKEDYFSMKEGKPPFIVTSFKGDKKKEMRRSLALGVDIKSLTLSSIPNQTL